MTGWVKVGLLSDLGDDDVRRFGLGERTFAIYRAGGNVYATDGLCTHEQIHLSDGLVMDHVIECPMHNGRFDIRNGRALGAPACVDLKTYPAKVEGDAIFIQVD
jgi:3-phenylpropionate/trans-cinnamate dioxygenase ferredoxin component